MMKPIFISLAALLLHAAGAAAQTDSIATAELPQSADDVMFGAVVTDSRLSADNAALLQSKMEQILGRCNAGASGSDGFFVVVPTINQGETGRTEGLVKNVATLSGELVLTAKNRYDGSVYYSATVPLKAVAKGDATDGDNMLIRSIKVTNPVYVRFVRNARANAYNYVAAHPESLRRPAPIAPGQPGDSTLIAAAPANPVAAVVPAHEQPAGGSATLAGVGINIGDPGWDVKVVGATYNPTYRNVTLTLSITNLRNGNRNGVYTAITNVLKTDGTNLKDYGSEQSHHDFPYNVAVTVPLYIKNVYSNPGTLPYLEVTLGGCKVEIRDLPVK